MAKTLRFSGSDKIAQYKTNSVRITEYIQNKTNKMTFDMTVESGDYVPQEGAEVLYKDAGRFLFGGYVTKTSPVEYGEGSLFVYQVECSDYGFVFNNKIVRRAYTNTTLGDIVVDIMTDFVGASYAFNTANVATGPTINSVTFDHVNVRKAFEKLSKLTGYVWYVDYEKNLYFQTQTAETAPEQITDSTANFEDITIDYDTSQVRNSVIVIGNSAGQQSQSIRTETFTGDGDTRSWALDEKPSQVVRIKLDGVAQNFSLDVNEQDTDYFTYSFSGKSFSVTEGNSAPGVGQTIIFEYYPRVPIISQEQDASSIAFFAALDGGDGIIEHTLIEADISSKQEAVERALQELEEYADPLVLGVFNTRSGLLTASPASIFKPGQALTVNLPTWGISTDTVFLIQEVNISVIENGTETEYFYNVRFGGRLVNVQTFLESLASQQGQQVTDVDEIKTIFKVDGEDVEIAEQTPTRVNQTPPFEYGPGGSPQGVWDKSEWG